jgi:hypothetical protein
VPDEDRQLWQLAGLQALKATFEDRNRPLTCGNVELVRRYSNHADLQERLSKAARKVTQTTDQDQEPRDETSSGRTGRDWRLSDRLTERAVSLIIERYQEGATGRSLADEFEISHSSIKRQCR